MKRFEVGGRMAICTLLLSILLGGCDGSGDTTQSGGSGGGGSGGTGSSGGAGGGGTGGAQAQAVTVSGSVVDFETGQKVATTATLSTTGLTPAPTISVTAADFKVEGVAPFSAFYMLAGAPPDYRSTYNGATEVLSQDVSGVTQAVVAETFMTKLANGFGTISTPGTGMIIARCLDSAGNPKQGVSENAFLIEGAPPPKAPRFLDETLTPATNLNATSPSGYVVFYDVPAGLVTISAADGSGVGIVSPQIPSASNVVSLATLTVTNGDPVLPTNVSFSNDVVPIFTKRGCEVCHSGNSPGADLGNLSLNGGDNSIHKELTQEVSKNFNTTRVNLMMPEMSLLLTMPSGEDPPDPHPNATFTGPADPDYLTILGWITEGAQQN